MSVIIQRRKFLLGFVSLVTAPAIVHFEHIMPVRSLKFSSPPLELIGVDGVVERLTQIDADIVRKILASQFVYVR
jgi:hypothetical protein